MVNRIRFRFQETDKRKRLTVGLPSGAVEQLLGRGVIDDGGLYISKKKVLHTESANDYTEVGLNLVAVGRLGDNNKSKAIGILNNVLSGIVDLAQTGELEPDDAFVLQAYRARQDKLWLIQCVAEVAKPAKRAESMQHIVTSYMAAAAVDLRLIPQVTSRLEYKSRAAVLVDWQGEHVDIGWDNPGMGTLTAVEFHEGGAGATLAGELRDSAALTHLAGAVALATYR